MPTPSEDLSALLVKLREARQALADRYVELTASTALSYSTPGGTSVTRKETASILAELSAINAQIAALDPADPLAPLSDGIITAVR